MKKTNIQMRLGVNYPRFIDYLEWLVSKGFVVKDEELIENSEAFRLSAKGTEAYQNRGLDTRDDGRHSAIATTPTRLLSTYWR